MHAIFATAVPRWLWHVEVRSLRVPLLFVAIIFLAWLQAFCFPKPGELSVYLTAAERLRQGESIYRLEEMTAFCYPPFFALVFVPLTYLPPLLASWTWNAINLTLLASSLFTLDKLFPARATPSWRYTLTRYVLLGLLATRFLLSPLEYRSHDLVLLALLSLGLLAAIQRREGWLGFCCGLATACKVTPLLFLPMLILRGRWQAAGLFIITCSVANYLPDLIYPARSAELWSHQWFKTFVAKLETSGPADGSRAWRAWNHLNQGLAGTIYRLTTSPPAESAERMALNVTFIEPTPSARRGLTLIALTTVFLVSLWVVGSAVRTNSALLEIGIWSVLLSAMLLLSPMSSKQHFCTLIIPLAYVLDYALDHPKRQYLLYAGLAFVFVCGSCMVKDMVGRSFGNWALASGSLTWCALVCWCLAVHVLYREGSDSLVAKRLSAIQ